MLSKLNWHTIWIKSGSCTARLVLLLIIDVLLLLGVMEFAVWVAVIHRILLFAVTLQYAWQLDTANRMRRALGGVKVDDRESYER